MARLFPVRSSLGRVVVPLSLAFTAFVASTAALHSASAHAVPAPAEGAAIPARVEGKAALVKEPLVKVVVQGIVRDPSGKPLGGALVTPCSIDKASQPIAQPTVKTDAAGRYTVEATLTPEVLEAVRTTARGGKADLYVVVLVHAPGYAVGQQVARGTSAKGDASKVDTVKGDAAKGADVPLNDLTLTPGCVVRGRVVDEKGKPFAGIKVEIIDLRRRGTFASMAEASLLLDSLGGNSPLKRQLETVSGPDGRFEFSDLPRGIMQVALSGPQIKSIIQEMTIEAATAEPAAAETPPATPAQVQLLTVRPGARLSGRVLYPDGKPVVGVDVTATRLVGDDDVSFGDTTQTKADGTYEFESVEVGKIEITVASPSPEWAGARAPALNIKAGDTAKALDIKLSHGVLVAGFVREKSSGAPLKGISIYAQQGEHSVAGESDDKGRYQIRLQPGTYRFWADQDSSPDIITEFDEQQQITIGAKSTAAPNFLLRRGVTLTGIAKDEKGQPATGVTVTVRAFGPEKTAKVDDKGNWTLRGLDPQQNTTGKGKGVVRLMVDGEWTLRGNEYVTLPSPPLSLTLSRIALQKVTLRVVTEGGQPVPGATVTYQVFMSSAGDSWQDKTATTNAQGEAQLEGLRPEIDSVVTARKEGYTLRQKGQVTHLDRVNPEGPMATKNVVLEALDGKASGRVLDAGGQPVVGARVVCLAPTDLRDAPEKSGTLTDDKGQFVLQGLPRGKIVLAAAKGGAFGRAVQQGETPVELKLGTDMTLPKPKDVEAAFALLESWYQEARTKAAGQNGIDFQLAPIAVRLAPYDVARALAITTDEQGRHEEDFLAEAPVSWAYTDPQAALAWGKTVTPLIQQGQLRVTSQLQLAALTAQVDPRWARQVYDTVSQATAPTTLLTANTAGDAPRYAQLAALAAALHDPDAEGWRQVLTLAVSAMDTDGRATYLDDVAADLARGDLPAARKWATSLPPLLQVDVWGALITWATKHNVPAAQEMLRDLDALIHRADFPLPKPRAENEDYQTTPEDILSNAISEVLVASLDSDPRSAQAVLDGLNEADSYESTLRVEVTARLATAGDRDKVQEAVATMKAGYDMPIGNMAFVAAVVSDTLPQLSAQTFEEARDKLAKRNPDSQGGEIGAGYAYARRDFDPVTSRLLIESDWERLMGDARKTLAQGQKINNWNQMQNLLLVIRAMIPLSPTRANEMLREVTPLSEQMSYYGQGLRLRMINWLLADTPARRVMPLSRTNDND